MFRRSDQVQFHGLKRKVSDNLFVYLNKNMNMRFYSTSFSNEETVLKFIWVVLWITTAEMTNTVEVNVPQKI